MIERYAAMIRSLLEGPAPSGLLQSNRPIDRLVAAYWSGTRIEILSPAPASETERLAFTAWTELVDRPDSGSELFPSIAQSQMPSGAFTAAKPSTNLETYWYWELVLLHAVTSYALRSYSTSLLDSAKRAALYHLHETQPDHATTQPWALNAFLLSPDTYPLADQVLHTLRVQHPTGVTGVSAILLADTLRGLGQQV